MLIGQYAKAAMAGKTGQDRHARPRARQSQSASCATTASCRVSASSKAIASIVCSQDTQGDQAKGQTAMENCLQRAPDINVVYTINEPAAAGAIRRSRRPGKEKDVLIVSVDGGCAGVQERQGGHASRRPSQQYPLKMASLGVDAASSTPRPARRSRATSIPA